MSILRVPRFKSSDRVQRNAISAGLPYPLGTVTDVSEPIFSGPASVTWIHVRWDGDSYDTPTPAWTLQHASAVDQLGDLV